MKTLTSNTRCAIHLVPFIAVLAITACSSSKPDSSFVPPANSINNPVYGEKIDGDTLSLSPVDEAKLVFYRPGTATGTEAPVNVYVNGRYLSSLLPGGYVEHHNCAGPMQVAAIFDDGRIRPLGVRGNETELPLVAGKTYYLQVDTSGEGKQVVLTPVTSDQVYLGQYRRQAHVLARAPNCATAQVAAAVAPVVVAMPVAAPAAGARLSADSVRVPLEGWRAAWERGDYAAYTGYYAPEFKGTLRSHSEWLSQRRSRLNNQVKQVAVNGIALSTSEDSVTTDFAQVYHSRQFRDDGEKRLVWRQYGSEMKIVEEIFTPRR